MATSSAARQGLDGRAVLVTGGGSGIGLACARRLAADGARVTICGRSEERLVEAVAGLVAEGADARYAVADVTDEASIVAAVGVAAAADPTGAGALAAVVANAGGAHAVGPLVATDAAAFERDLALNVTGTFLTIKAAAPHLARSRPGGGAVVAVSSIATRLTHRLMAPYSVGKAAVDMLVRNAADELGAHGIRVNGVRPGLVPTGASDPLASHGPTLADYLAQMPLGRVGTVDDIAEAVRFLAGPESGWITGQLLGVDGGHSLRRGPDIAGLVPRRLVATADDLLRPA